MKGIHRPLCRCRSFLLCHGFREGIFVGYRGYQHNKVEPLFPFGYGLSYTSFAYGQIELDKAKLRGRNDVLAAAVTVRNTGTRAGEEIVQHYIGDPVASRSRPVRELKGFQKVALAPGEKKRVSFRITAAEMGFSRAERLAVPEPVFEPGMFVIQIGSSSQTLATASVEWCADA